MNRFLVAAGALNAAAAVVLGAYGAHGIGEVRDILRIWETGVEYQMWHSLGMFAAAWISSQCVGLSATLALIAGWVFFVGAFLFAGTLYFFVLWAEIPIQGAAPLGGVMMIAGWVLIAIAALKKT